VKEENTMREAIFFEENRKFDSPKRRYNGNTLGKKKIDGNPDMSVHENSRVLKDDERVLLLQVYSRMTRTGL
jgi:hypothetical protein